MIATLSFISVLLAGGMLIIYAYLIKGWASLKRPQLLQNTPSTKITILIAARDEEEGIHLTIEDILAQDYPKHLTEVIIVDDHSTDRTADIIRSYALQGIKLHQMQAGQALNSYKKKAISEAIEMSTGELMIATDADCRMGKSWLSTVVNYYETHNPVMISSPVTYFEEKTWFEYMQTLEFSFLIGIGASFIGNKRASTCNGANLAYRKDVFYEVGGFKGIDDLASGDDELLLQKIAEVYPGKIAFIKHREAIVYTHAKHTLRSFLQQRQRWSSKSTKYKNKKIVALAVYIWLFNVVLVVNAILGFYDAYFWKVLLWMFVFKVGAETLFLLPIMRFFRRSALVWLAVPLSLMHIFYLVYIGIIGNSKKYVWKGRLVR